MPAKGNARVIVARIRSRCWAWRVRAGALHSDATILRKIADERSWEEFWDVFVKEFPSTFYYSPRNQKDFFLQTLQSLQSYEEILDDANDAVSRVFDLLGSGPMQLKTPIDWSEDFTSGARWKMNFYIRPALERAAARADVKIPWELGRFQYLPWLGKAYWSSRSRRYSVAFQAFIGEWIAANPYCYGIQWGNAMEAAIRACNWIAGAAFFLEERAIETDFWKRFFVSLWRHGEFIEHNLEITRRSGNHLIADYTGLVFIGNFFSRTPQGRFWRRMGVAGIETEVMRQTSADGVDYEGSVHYHRFVAEMCLAVVQLCRTTGTPLGAAAAERIERMCEFTLHYTRGGSAPNIGDGDNGRLFRFRAREDFNDHSALLSTAAIVFARGDMKVAAGAFAQDSLWLTGTAGFERFRALGDAPPLQSKAFPEGGFYIMRSAHAHCIADAGELGKRGWGGHGHNDTFNFEFWMGERFIADSGTFCYLSDAAQRKYFRSAAAHNTIMIDGAEIADFAGPFNVRRDFTAPKIIRWESSAERDVLEAEHYGYTRLPRPAVHRRKFVFDKAADTLALADTIAGDGEHAISLALHFAPGIRVERTDSHTLRAAGLRRALDIVSTGEWLLEPCEISESYGVKRASTAARIFVRGALPIVVETKITGAVLL